MLLAGKQAISCSTEISEWNILCFPTEETLQLKQSFLLPAFRENDFDILSSFILNILKWQRLLRHGVYHPLEALPLSPDSEGRCLDSFKWGQQTSRLPAQARFDTVEISTVCGEKWKHNHAIPVSNSDIQSQLRTHLVAHCKVQTYDAHVTSLPFRLSLLKCWVLFETSVLAKCSVITGGMVLWIPHATVISLLRNAELTVFGTRLPYRNIN